jgi:Xaa-Pro aminopeptidase
MYCYVLLEMLSNVNITGIPSTPTQATWLIKTLPPGSRVGADPNLVMYSTWKPLQTDLEAAGIFLVPIATNLIDLIWDNKPAVPCNTIHPLSIKYTGEWKIGVLNRLVCVHL